MITADSYIKLVMAQGSIIALNNCGITTACLKLGSTSSYCIWTSASDWGHVHPEGIVTRYDVAKDMHVTMKDKTKKK
jgi:hypothetical protein